MIADARRRWDSATSTRTFKMPIHTAGCANWIMMARPTNRDRQRCVGEWADCVPKAMSLAVFIDAFLPSLDEQAIAVGVFYTPTDNGVLVPPLDLAQRLREYEDTWY